ncbi:HD domain-containing protein [Bdellovibrio bacteriovorus]|uniref:HD domain-containing protein n=1 Tax=Bdellovibrio bacteriovorus TaxID=959 RepID=UPI0021D10334|nr:HD domain-containing protein [Bdellovibrio bacteriovorus]UXR65367.1 HD domain-containing protein [Bdellovibrio bacteriovorus]
MEIRDPVHGSIYYSEPEVAVLDTAEYQRLRAIKQLGYAEFSFPGATHNRYIHSVGVGHLAGETFDAIFRVYPFSKPSVKTRFRQVLRLGALLHDVGHGPLSHTTEQVMPHLSELKIQLYKEQEQYGEEAHTVMNHNRRANHEDYTIKYVTDSAIADTIRQSFPDIQPIHVACLIDKALHCPDDFFVDNGVDFRPILSQLVSSELDVDRMDYLERDSYFCGTNYGKIDLSWLIQNMTFHRRENKMYLGLNRRALYSFDDFLISRHHMHLMVYCHHKSIIYEEMLNRYLTSPDCTFVLPGDINEYTHYNDYRLHEHLSSADNPWAQRIAQRKPFKVLIEQHNTSESDRPEAIKKALEAEGIEVIRTSSKARLSKYHTASPEERALQIYVVDQYDRWAQPSPINQTTEIFQRYEGARIIDRIYVAPENLAKAEGILKGLKL